MNPERGIKERGGKGGIFEGVSKSASSGSPGVNGKGTGVTTDPRQIAVRSNARSSNGNEKTVDYRSGRGRSHPLHDGITRLRDLFFGLGFTEMELSYFVPDTDIKKLYGPHSGSILTESYFLSHMKGVHFPPPEDIARAIENVLPGMEQEEVINRLIGLMKNPVNIDDLANGIMVEFQIPPEKGRSLIDVLVREEICELENQRITLRKEMGPPWMPTVKAVQKLSSPPIKIFTIGMGFHHEPVLDAMHLRNHYTASLVILDRSINMDSIKEVLDDIMEGLHIAEHRLDVNPDPSHIFKSDRKFIIRCGEIKVGECGELSPEVLQSFDIEGAMFLVDLGLEHMIMVSEGYPDIRELLYPQFYSAWSLSDLDIARSIKPIKRPETAIGKIVARAVKKGCLMNRSVKTPARKVLWTGEVYIPDITESEESLKRHRLKITLENPYAGTTLCGPAFNNQIFVSRGDITGIPVGEDEDKNKTGPDRGIRVKYSYLDGFALMVGNRVEDLLGPGKSESVKSGMVKNLQDVNLKLDRKAYRFIKSNQRDLDVKGPVFLQVNISIKKSH